MTWLVWSNEHGAWWRPYRNGYTNDRQHAGRYSFEDALEIVTGANMAIDSQLCEPNESMCPSWD